MRSAAVQSLRMLLKKRKGCDNLGMSAVLGIDANVVYAGAVNVRPDASGLLGGALTSRGQSGRCFMWSCSGFGARAFILGQWQPRCDCAMRSAYV